MCRFCATHGDGEIWYLRAENYAADLSSDLERRGYMVTFLADFERNRRKAILGMEALRLTPAPLAASVKERVSAVLERNHFGQPVPIEDCERILHVTTSVVNLPCPCRRFARTEDRGYCLAVTTQPVDDILVEGMRDYGAGPDTLGLQRLDRDGAMDLLRRAENEGLMHSVWTFKTPFIGAICNCDLASGCMAMRLQLSYGTRIMWRGENVASLDADTCTKCGSCVERCPFGALKSSAAGGIRLDASACWGCGVCRSGCETGALRLEPRNPPITNEAQAVL